MANETLDPNIQADYDTYRSASTCTVLKQYIGKRFVTKRLGVIRVIILADVKRNKVLFKTTADQVHTDSLSRAKFDTYYRLVS